MFQAERACAESSKISTIQENEMLLQELDVAREQLENLHKQHEELEMKSKADLKLLVKEVKSLRNSQSELKQELSHLMREKLELEVVYCTIPGPLFYFSYVKNIINCKMESLSIKGFLSHLGKRKRGEFSISSEFFDLF